MTQIDNIHGMDWGDAQYIGDGVYLRDCTDKIGIPSVALRTDRFVDGRDQHFVIVLDLEVFNDFVHYGTKMLHDRHYARVAKAQTEALNEKMLSEPIEVGTVTRISSPDERKDGVSE